MKVIFRQLKLESIFDKVLDAGAAGASIFLIFIMLAISVEVVLRRIGHPSVWEVEVTEYSLLYITFLGAAWLLRKEGHVRMDILVNAFSRRIQALLGVIVSTVGSALSLYLVIFGMVVTWDYFRRGIVQCTPLLTPSFLVTLVIPLGSVPLAIQFLRRAHGFWKVLRPPPSRPGK